MARKKRNHQFDLPALELRCMKALWNLGKGTVHEIRAQLMPEYPLAYTTVMTVMDRLDRKGVVEREKRGRAHLYRPVVAREIISEHVLTQLVENFFGGSREELRKHLEQPGKPLLPRVAVEGLLARQHGNPTASREVESKPEAAIDTSLL